MKFFARRIILKRLIRHAKFGNKRDRSRQQCNLSILFNQLKSCFTTSDYQSSEFVSKLLFHLQILTCHGISERERIIAQCTEENNILRRFVMNLSVFVVFFYKPGNQEQMLSVTVNSTYDQ